jgi:RimJ/RimL family protein N-acetyltransferase
MYSVKPIKPCQWQLLKSLRIAALKDCPECILGDYAEESMRGESEWIEFATQNRCFMLLDGDKPIGFMAITNGREELHVDCWLFSCWIDPSYRGQGLLHLLMQRFDQESYANGWKVQGLGVLPNNLIATRAFEQMGFKQSGDLKPSLKYPGHLFQLMLRILPSK